MTLALPDFPTLEREGIVYLDTSATAQTVRPAIEAMDRYYETYRATIHRSVYSIANEATEAYEEARAKVAAFAGAGVGETVFTRNATEAINLVARAWGGANVGPDGRDVEPDVRVHGAHARPRRRRWHREKALIPARSGF